MMSHIHVDVLHKLRIKAWVVKENWWSASWYQQSQIGVVWFCQLKTNPVTLHLFFYHHGTGPCLRNWYNRGMELPVLLFTTPACGDLVPCILSGLSNNSAIVVTCKPSHNAKLNISHLLLLYKPDSKNVGTLYKLWIKKECNNLQIS